ncbi:MAG: ATP-dependent Clp protease adaptor ClpS [Treponema sp.]|jgi:ATP-dependent Clp protease adaptor protein ClpS|nr:ATP-dependent Clp protease adaptor ClpS [Treponema sp.]
MGEIKSSVKKKEKLKESKDFKVIVLNDDYTTMDFVIYVLKSIFHKNEAEAHRIMLYIHKKGQGTAGQYPLDIARTKMDQVHSLARENEFPLVCILEEV